MGILIEKLCSHKTIATISLVVSTNHHIFVLNCAANSWWPRAVYKMNWVDCKQARGTFYIASQPFIICIWWLKVNINGEQWHIQHFTRSIPFTHAVYASGFCIYRYFEMHILPTPCSSLFMQFKSTFNISFKLNVPLFLLNLHCLYKTQSGHSVLLKTFKKKSALNDFKNNFFHTAVCFSNAFTFCSLPWVEFNFLLCVLNGLIILKVTIMRWNNNRN